MPFYKEIEDAPSDLHQLLLKVAPVNKRGRRTIKDLAVSLGMTDNGVRKWLRTGKVPPERVVQMVALSEGRVSINDFSRYVFQMTLDLNGDRP